MPDQSLTCAQIQAASGGFLEQTLSHRSNDGSGHILIEVRYTHDGVSVRPNCDGPITRLRTRNTSGQTAWALLPNKRKAPKWVQIDPGTDVTIANQGALNQIGIETFSDAANVQFVYIDPTPPAPWVPKGR